MSKFLRFNGIDYKITSIPKIKTRTKSASISNVEIDFQGGSLAELPVKLQEVKVINNPKLNETVELIAYVDDLNAPEYDTGNENTLLKLKLLPTRIQANLRTVTKKYESESLNTLVEDVVSPLIADGFTIEFNDLPSDVTVTTTLIKKTVEKSLNELSKTYDFVWHIDDFKKIYFRDSKTLFNQEINTSWNEQVGAKYLDKIKPIIKTNDYANFINLKNALVISNENVLNTFTTGNGKRYKLEKPIWLSSLAIQKKYGNNIDRSNILIITLDGVDYTIDYTGGVFVKDSGLINYNLNSTTLDIGLIYNENDPELLTEIVVAKSFVSDVFISVQSQLALKTELYQFYDPNQINQTKVLTNTSGIVEKTISLNKRRFGQRELFSIARGNIVQANNETNVIKASLKHESSDSDYINYVNNINLFSRFVINLPKVLSVGDFVVTSIEKIETQEMLEVKLILENKNFNETYLDIYRKVEIEEDKRQIDESIVSILVKDEDFIETNQILVDGEVVNDVN